MKKTLTYARFQCDRCPTQTDEHWGQYPDGWRDMYNYRTSTKYDFCPKCADSFQRWLHGVPKPDRESPSAAEITLEKLEQALTKLEAQNFTGGSYLGGWQGALREVRKAMDYLTAPETPE